MIIVPHGGCRPPDELLLINALSDFDIFMNSDACANDIFSFERNAVADIKTDISRLYIDTDRILSDMPPSSKDGVMKVKTPSGKSVYRDNLFPGDIAISNILARYYLAFHEKIKETIETADVRLILEFHTMMPVGPAYAKDADQPRPLVKVEHKTRYGGRFMETAPETAARELAECIMQNLGSLEGSVAGDYEVDSSDSPGYLMRRYGTAGIPMMKVSLSRALFINEHHFNWEFLKADEIRLGEIRNSVWQGIEYFIKNFF